MLLVVCLPVPVLLGIEGGVVPVLDTLALTVCCVPLPGLTGTGGGDGEGGLEITIFLLCPVVADA